MNIHQYRSLDLNDPLMRLGAKIERPTPPKPQQVRRVSENILEVDGMLKTTVQANYGVPLDKPAAIDWGRGDASTVWASIAKEYFKELQGNISNREWFECQFLQRPRDHGKSFNQKLFYKKP